MSLARAARSQPVSVGHAEPCTWGSVSLHAGSVTAPGQTFCFPWHKDAEKTWAVQRVWLPLPKSVWPCLWQMALACGTVALLWSLVPVIWGTFPKPIPARRVILLLTYSL